MRTLALLLALLGAGPATGQASHEVIGRSAEERELRATRTGDPRAPVDLSNGADRDGVLTYGKRVTLPARTLPDSRGTTALATGADAVLAGRRAAAAPVADKPPIRWTPIPFGEDRREQMRGYARRHYGLSRSRLVAPKVVVEHFTASSSFSSAFDTFAANAPDPELGELPGVCAHFLIDADGTIHQLVQLRWMCRHTIGLNHVAFGIEHVGTSDGQVMGRRRQLEASLRLTRWLQARHGIETKDVIGHAESLGSPHHSERVEALRDRTHGDFAPATMRRYRKRLAG